MPFGRRGFNWLRGNAPAAALVLTALAGAAGCDGSAPAVDAATPPSAQTSALSLRIDVPTGKPATLSVLAFRAAFSGVAESDVLGLVDPLAATAPSHDCQIRDVDKAAAALVARGDAIELEELSGIGIGLPDVAGDVHPSPRLYPDLAATIGGVVGEAGPFRLSAIPEQFRVTSGIAPASIYVPTTEWVRLLNGSAPRDGSLIEISADLNLAVTATAKVGHETDTSIELRPFGATVALSCAVPAGPASLSGIAQTQTAFAIPRQALAALLVASGATPGASVAAALDVVRRSTTDKLATSDTRISVEVRTSTFVEMRP
jgi:hypothetical protein